jgi:competence protein ComEC
VRLPDTRVMLIDGGVGKPDMGRIVIAPFLWSRGIKNIDYLVLSHAHPDHFGGLKYIINNFSIGEVWTNSFITSDEISILTGAEKESFTHRVLSKGDMLEGEDYKITVLHPYSSFFAGSPRGEFSNENSRSLVLKIDMEKNSILFTGDIEEEAEESLLYSAGWLRSDILKMPHHGGRTSSSIRFINAVKPRIAVVSAGKNNPFHHPHASTLQRYKEAGVQIFRTDRNGAITVRFIDGRYSTSKYYDNELLPVTHWRDEIRNLRLLFAIQQVA